MAAIAEAVRHMLAAGLAADAIVAAIADMEAAAAPVIKPRSSHAERQARYRERKASQSVTESVTVTESDVSDVTSVTLPLRPSPPLPPKEIPPTPPKEITLFPDPIPQPRVSGASAFEEIFWPAFPNKVGKRDAEKAFERASKRVGLETMMGGLARYAEKTDDRPWCNPATWLNQDRWKDQPATAPPPRQNQRMTKAQQLGEELRNDIAGRFEFQRSGREEGQDLQSPQRLLAISGKAGS